MTTYVSATLGDPAQPLDKAVRVALRLTHQWTTTHAAYRYEVVVTDSDVVRVVAGADDAGPERPPPQVICSDFRDTCLRIAKAQPRFELFHYFVLNGLRDDDPAKAALLTVWTNMRTVLSAPGDLLPRDGGPRAAAVTGRSAAAVPSVADLTEEVFKL